jgi:hypothetical protein
MQAPPQAQFAQPVPGRVQQPNVAPAYPMPRSGGGFPVAVTIVLVVFGALLLAGGVGLFFALRGAAGRLSSANVPIPAVSLPVASPGGGSLSLPPIRGATVSRVTAALVAKGYQCTDTRQVSDTWITSCSLTDDQNKVVYEVSLGGSDSTSVGLISAGLVSTGGGSPTKAEASQFFSVIVGAVGQGSEVAQANSWIPQNLDAGGDTTAGNLRLHLSSPSSAYLLIVTST